MRDLERETCSYRGALGKRRPTGGGPCKPWAWRLADLTIPERIRAPGVRHDGKRPTGRSEQMTKWEIAHISWEGTGRGKHRSVNFSHRPPWEKISGDSLYETMQALGNDGFELVGHSGESGWNAWWFKRPLD